MKVVVIGGGIAGLATAIALKRNGNEVTVKEKGSYQTQSGMAFLIRSKALRNLQLLVNNNSIPLQTNRITRFELKNHFGALKNSVSLEDWILLKRNSIVDYLRTSLTDNELHENSEFSHFVYEGNRAVAAVFKNGAIEFGDLFIGADGIRSKVRNSVCATEFYPNEINEVVCLLSTETPQVNTHLFTKYQASDQGLSFGFIPLSETEYVWFNQFDRQLADPVYESCHGDLQMFCLKLLSNFPAEVRRFIEHSDFTKAHLWKNRGLRLLKHYYRENICLIGDAAHGSISLTSAGITSAISDTFNLSDSLNKYEHLEHALLEYEWKSKSEAQKTIDLADTLKKQFLRGGIINDSSYEVPLMK